MVVTPDDIKGMLPKYQGLSDTQIQEAIDIAKAYLDGLNGDWIKFEKADTILKLSATSFTLKLHFPQNVDQYTSLDNSVMDMVNSIWSSSRMLKKRTGFVRMVGSKK